MSHMIGNIALESDRGIRHTESGALQCHTKCPLLENDHWPKRREDFGDRFTHPGMASFDIDADVGICLLPPALRGGAKGWGITNEVDAENQEHLEHSPDPNGLTKRNVSSAARPNFSGSEILTDRGSGVLQQQVAISEDGDCVECIQVTNFDIELRHRKWPCVGFVKLNAEGQKDEMFYQNVFDSSRLLRGRAILVQVYNHDPHEPFHLNFVPPRLENAANHPTQGSLVHWIGSTTLSERENCPAAPPQNGQTSSRELFHDDIFLRSAKADALIGIDDIYSLYAANHALKGLIFSRGL